MAKITIAIPAYNSERLIEAAIASCQMQDYGDKEILVGDDYSTDKTAELCRVCLRVQVIENAKNVGVAKNIQNLIDNATGEYIVFLCDDDKFTHPMVVSDIVKIFEENPDVGVVDRNYYQYMEGYEGAVVEVRERNPVISSVNSSGMAIRKAWAKPLSDKIYVEFPTMIKEMLKTCRWIKMDYDTVAVRIHKNNMALRKSYYKGSVTQNWHDLLGDNINLWRFKDTYITYKTRAGLQTLLKEIRINIKLKPEIRLHPAFYFWAAVAILVPRWILIPLADFYRHRISRLWCRIERRPE